MRVYLWLVTSLAIGALVLTARAGPSPEVPDLIVAGSLLILGLLAQHFPLEVGPQHKTDMAMAVYVAAVLTFPLSGAVVLVGLSHLLGQITLALRRNPATGRRRRGVRGILFNTSQVVLATWAAASMYGWLATTPLLAIPLAAGAMYVTNYVAVQIMLALQHGLATSRTVLAELVRQLPEFIALCSIGVVSALAIPGASVAPWLVALPTAAVYHIQRRGLQLMAAEQRARIEAERARGHLRLLANASLQLANSLDFETTLRSVVGLGVPELADWCLVTLCTPSDGTSSTRTIGYLNPDLGSHAARLQADYPFDPYAAVGVARVVDSGRAELFPEVPDGLLVSAARDPEHLRLLRALGLRCAMILPLVASDRRFGAISYYSVHPQRQYARDELGLAQELAARCALSIEHARLYEEQLGMVGQLRQLSKRLGAAERDQLLTDERHRIAYELHDRVQQAFFGIGLAVGSLLESAECDAQAVRTSLAHAQSLAAQGADDLRAAIFALTRAEIEDRGLVRTLWHLVRRFRKSTQLAADLVVAGAERGLAPEIAEVLHTVARECLANVEQHAAASVVIVSLRFEPDAVTLTVQDDGVGASPLVMSALTESATHFGLRSIRERVSRLGGTFTTEPGDDGGFLARTCIPIAHVDRT